MTSWSADNLGHWKFHFKKPSLTSDGFFLSRVSLIDAVSPLKITAEGCEKPFWVERWKENYLQGKSSEVDLILDHLSPFSTKVLKAIQSLSFGITKSYREVAIIAGNERASRAVGNACRNNPYPLLIPCHRVISSGGNLGGYALPITLKRNLISFEEKFFQKL